MVKVETVKMFGWDNCIKLSGAGIEVVVTTDVGPRIISLTCNGKANHLATFNSQLGTKGNDEFVPYGGHRLWHAPEVAGRTDLPDNEPCYYMLKDNGVFVCSKVDKSGIVKGMDISIDDNAVITVEHMLRNENLFDVELSIWGISQLALGGVLAVPQSKLDTGLVANRAIAMWPYSKMNDARVFWGENFVTVKPDTAHEKPFKFGVSCDEQYAAYFNHNQMVLKEFEYYYGAEYPNYYCNFESYTNSDFIEFESLSPLFTLESGDEERHIEKWYVLDNVACPDFKDEKAIEKALKAARGNQ